MNRSSSDIKGYLIIVGVLVVGLLCGLWLFNGEKKIINEDLGGVIKNSDEFMEGYFDSYAEMTASGEQENILIVVSDSYPNEYGASRIVEGPNHTYYLMYDSAEEREDAYAQFAEDDTVSVERNVKMELLDYMSWGVEKIGLDEGIMKRGDGGEDVKVAVIDTGLDVDLFQQYYPSRELSVYNVDADSVEYEMMEDTVGHGTHIAGTITEGTMEQTGIVVIKADKNEELFVASVNTAIYKAMEMDVDVINMSFGGSGYSRSLKMAIDAANEVGIVTVAAAGNDNNAELLYPAGLDNTISVSALDFNLERAVWDEEKGYGSNYNAMVDYAAPGTMIRSINGFASGTSMAAPHVTAVVALLKSYNKDLGLNEMNILLQKHVVDLGEEGRDDYYGYGMIDLHDVKFCRDVYCDEYGVFAVDVSIEDLTNGAAEIGVLGDGIMVTADKACMVIVSDSNEYRTLPAVVMTGDRDKYKFEFDVVDGVEVIVVLKGDGDMDGTITPADLNRLNRSLISPTSGVRYRALTDLERVIFDFDDDGGVTPADLNTLNRALVSSTSRLYKAIMW